VLVHEPHNIHVGPVDAPYRYELLERKAAGGEGEVWKARQFHAGQPFLYAVKIIEVDGGDVTGRRLEDLRMQAALATQLEHPALVKVKEVFVGAAPAGEAGQRLYFVMKWIEGRSMQDALNQGALRGLDALDWLEPIADALDYLHAGTDTNGVPVLHRDIKPANIVRANDGRTYLIDFGLLRMRSDSPTSRIFGTVPFMAPETFSRGEYSPATDRYAIGASAYYAITGEGPMLGNHEGMEERLAAELAADLGAGGDRVASGIVAMLRSQPGDRWAPRRRVRTA
jgi:serine/threonine protein kinase